jgi:peptidoglycan/LPS O-acetylase OafA/YrhL
MMVQSWGLSGSIVGTA